MGAGWEHKRGVALAVSLILLLGCSSSGQRAGTRAHRTPPAARGTGGADLPPAGRGPVVGTKPPMPAPVVLPTVPGVRVEDFATGLRVPWEMAFLPGGRVLVTERPGRVRLISGGRLQEKPYATIRVRARGEGGLLGIAAHPGYPNPRYIYLYYTHPSGHNRVSRFTDTGSGLTGEKVLIGNIPAGTVHNGGILRFGPDGKLYVGTGDTWHHEIAQSMNSLGGKVLRINPDGSIPGDNPFPGSPIYALGLRNVQGLAWEPGTGALWADSHGPSGEYGLHAMDMVFKLRPGANAGWPRTIGVVHRRGVTDPILFFPDRAVPPGAMIFYTGSLFPQYRGNLFFTSLGAEHLERVVLGPGDRIQRIERWWQTGPSEGRYGRLRALAQGPDGAIYVSTSNQDGRGNVRPGDDHILRLVPASR